MSSPVLSLDSGNPSVEELAEMAVRRMRLKLSRAALQDELAGDTETQTQQQHQGAVSSRSEIPEMLLLDKAAGNTAGNTGGGHVQKSNSRWITTEDILNVFASHLTPTLTSGSISRIQNM